MQKKDSKEIKSINTKDKYTRLLKRQNKSWRQKLTDTCGNTKATMLDIGVNMDGKLFW